MRDYAAHGIRLWLWEADSLLAAACVGALFRLASTENEIRSRVRMVHQHWEEKHARLTEQAVKEIRAEIIDGSAANSLSAVSIDFNEQDWPELLDALDMISPCDDQQRRGKRVCHGRPACFNRRGKPLMKSLCSRAPQRGRPLDAAWLHKHICALCPVAAMLRKRRR